MSLETTTEQTNPTLEPIEWEPPMPPTDLIFDDGEPLESNRHRVAMNVLIRSLNQGWSDRQDFFAGGNMFVYYSSSQVRNRDFRGPDFFAVLGVDADSSRQGWVVWEEGGRYPDVIVEMLSPSTASVDLGAKKTLYEQVFRTRDYFVYDPFNPNAFQGWHLDLDQGYQPIPVNEQGWRWCQTLELWLGSWSGAVDIDTTTWLRFYDRDGNLVLLPEEAERQRADEECRRADEECRRADEECRRADEERQRADEQYRRADEERQRADRLAARLRELGEDPNGG